MAFTWPHNFQGWWDWSWGWRAEPSSFREALKQMGVQGHRASGSGDLMSKGLGAGRRKAYEKVLKM